MSRHRQMHYAASVTRPKGHPLAIHGRRCALFPNDFGHLLIMRKLAGSELRRPGISSDERRGDEEGVSVGEVVSSAVPLSDVGVVKRALDEAA